TGQIGRATRRSEHLALHYGLDFARDLDEELVPLAELLLLRQGPARYGVFAVQPLSEIGQKSSELHNTIVSGLARRARFLPPELPRDYTNVGRISIQIAVYPALVGLDARLLRGPAADSNLEPIVVRPLEHL